MTGLFAQSVYRKTITDLGIFILQKDSTPATIFIRPNIPTIAWFYMRFVDTGNMGYSKVIIV